MTLEPTVINHSRRIVLRMRSSIWWRLGVLAFCLVILAPRISEAAHAGFAGAPPVERFSPDLDVYPQNFQVVQDPNGIVYLGNYEGLLEFDGERWRLMPMPNGDLVRALAVGPDGTVYVGGYNIFGYLNRNSAGQVKFVDVAEKFSAIVGKREVEDIWQVLVAQEGVYFRALNDVFFWDPKTGATAHWQHADRFGVIAVHEGKTMLQFRGEGFKLRDGATWRLRPETRHLTTLIQSLVPLADGGLLTIGNDGKWWRIDSNTVTPARMPADVPASLHFTNGLTLQDKSIALISVEGGVTILNPGLTRSQNIKLDPGFLSGISAARDGGFLVSSQQSIYRVSWPTIWSVLGAEHGAQGDFEKIASWNGDDYLMTSGGALKMRSTAAGAHFSRTPWGGESTFDLIGLSATQALLAGTHRLKVIKDGVLRDHSTEIIYPRRFLRSRYRPEQIFLGTDGGLRLIDTKGGSIRVSGSFPKDVSTNVLAMIERGPNELWAGTERQGLWRYTLSDKGEIISAVQFGMAQGLRFGKLAEAMVAAHPDGSLLVSTRKGVFRLLGEKFVATDLDGLDKLRAPEELVSLLFDASGDQWAYGPTRIYHKINGGVWRQQDVRSLRRGAIGLAFLDSVGQVVFVCTNALLVRHPAPQSEGPPAPQVMLRAVTQLMSDGKTINLPLASETPVRLQLDDFALRFEFALPELVRPGIKQYQGRLVGVDDGPMVWSKETGYTYSELSAKTYRLEVSATDSIGRKSALIPYAIIIDPPWYATVWARTMAGLVILLLAWLSLVALAGYRTRRLQREKQLLEKNVEARTRELEEANRRLDMMAHVDGLTGVPNRRRLDEYLAVVWANCAEQKKPLSLLAIDVDHFKNYNDRHGHVAGDELLKGLVRECLACLRRTEDLLARYGGEEFVVVLPGADLAVARSLAEAIRMRVAGSALDVTVSIGVSSSLPSGDTQLGELFARADEALYTAKRGGRNRVSVQNETGVDGNGAQSSLKRAESD